MKTVFKALVVLVLAVLLFGGGFAAGMAWTKQGEPALSASTIETQITDCSDLATSKLEYNGLVKYEAGDIPLINKKTFTMVYEAEVTAGVDLSQAKVSINGKQIDVVLPAAQVQTVSIDPNSLKFYDSSFALFNWENKDDTAQALIAANNDVKSKVDETSMLSKANAQAHSVVENLLLPFTDSSQGYTLNITQAS